MTIWKSNIIDILNNNSTLRARKKNNICIKYARLVAILLGGLRFGLMWIL